MTEQTKWTPEPVAYQYKFIDPLSGNSVWRFDRGPWNAQKPRSSRPLYAMQGIANPEAVSKLIKAAREAHDGLREIARRFEHARSEARGFAEELRLALAALEQERGAPSITARTVATEEGVASEVEYVNENGVVVGYWAYGHFDTRYPYQGEQHQSGGEHEQ